MGACGSKDAGEGGGGGQRGGPRLRFDDEEGDKAFKLVMIGNRAVGKSSLVLRYTKDQFTDTHELTIGAAFTSRDVPITMDGMKSSLKLHIWDTAGEEMYRAITRSFYRDSNAALLVYDVTDRSTFDGTRTWLNDFKEACPEAVVLLVGNKCDLEEDRVVSVEEGKKLGEELGCISFECSARSNVGVSHVFEKVAADLFQIRASERGL